MRIATTGLLLAVLTFGMAGCAGSDSEPDTATPADGGTASRILTVPEAIKAGDQQLKVRGYVLVSADGVARICTGLAGSYPPQCGNPSLEVKGLKPDELPGKESASGIVWTGETTLRGVLEGGVLTLA